MRNAYLTIACALSILTGCNKTEYGGPDLQGVKAKIYGTIDQSLETKIDWTTDAIIGVSVDSGNVYSTNNQYRYVGDESRTFEALIPNSDIFVKGRKGMRFTAYYPYTGANGATAGLVNISTTSDKQLPENRDKIDLLFAEANSNREDPAVHFNFKHQMSQLKFHFQSEQPINGNISYKLSGLVLAGNFDPSNGKVSAGSSKEVLNITVGQEANGVSSLIIIPQIATQLLLEVGVNGRYYTATIDQVTLESGNIHSYNVEISGSGVIPSLIVTAGTVTKWLSGGEHNIDSSEI